MNIRVLLFVVLISACNILSSMGGVIVSVQDANISPNGTSYVDVLISSDSSDNLDSFSFRLNIADVGSPAGTLKFDSDANQLTVDPSSDTNYVFFGDSGGYSANNDDPGFTFLGNPTTAIDVLDLTSSNAGVTLDTDTKLLARVALIHTTASSGASISDSYQVSVSGASYLENDGVTSLSVSSTSSGTITVVQSVPEPSSCFIVAVLTGFGVTRRSSRSRRSILCR